MHILLPTLGTSGDLFPLLGVGRELKARGHRVTVVAPPIHQEAVRDAALGYEGYASLAEVEALLNNPNLWHPQRGFDAVARYAIAPATRAVYEIIARHQAPDLVVAAHSMALGAQIAHEKLGVPTISLHLQPTLIRSRIAPAQMGGIALPSWTPPRLVGLWYRLVDRLVVDRVLAGPVNALRAELGLPAVSRLFDQWLHRGDRIVGLFPAWFAPIQPDWPSNVSLVGFPLYEAGQEAPLPTDLLAFLGQGEPPLLATFGSGMRHAADAFRVTIESVLRLGRRAIVATRDITQLPDRLPDTILHVPFVPFGTLMPHVAAVVHHGGIGTVAQALAAGVPQLIVPQSHDQPDNGARIARLGAGYRIGSRRFRGRRAEQVLDWLLNDGALREQTRALAARVERDGCARAATIIEQVGQRQIPP